MIGELRPNEINYTEDFKILVPQINDRLATLTEELNKLQTKQGMKERLIIANTTITTADIPAGSTVHCIFVGEGADASLAGSDTTITHAGTTYTATGGASPGLNQNPDTNIFGFGSGFKSSTINYDNGAINTADFVMSSSISIVIGSGSSSGVQGAALIRWW